MLATASRAARPKLSLSISTATTTTATSSSAPGARPALSLRSPIAAAAPPTPRTPISPSPISPTVRNTRLNQRGFSTLQVPSFAYANPAGAAAKGILKKGPAGSSAAGKRIQFTGEPTVYCVTPIENAEDYYGAYMKMSKDERRWRARNYD